MDLRMPAQALAAGRIAFGLGFLAAPGPTARPWIGASAEDRATKVFIRAMGARDAALGAGGLHALRARRRPARPWLVAQAASDLADLLATLLARERLPPAGFWFASAMAAGSAVVGAAAAATID